MTRFYRSPLDQQAIEFLRQNDPMFLRKSKKTLMDYPYLSEKQMKKRIKREIPATALGKRQVIHAQKLDHVMKSE